MIPGRPPAPSLPAGQLSQALRALKERDFALAEALARALLEADPSSGNAAHVLGVTLLAQGRAADARVPLEQACAALPGDRHAPDNLSRCLEQLGDWDGAVRALRAAGGARTPERLAGLHWRAARARMKGGDLAAAKESLAHFVVAKPGETRAWSTYGDLLKESAEFAAAGEAYARALALGLESVRDRYAHMLGLQGRLTEFWPLYEWRYDAGNDKRDAVKTPQMPMPMWRGEALKGKRVLVWNEQGYGDTLQFCRYAQMLHAAGARVTLAVQAPLLSLMQGLPGSESVRGSAGPAPAAGEFDYWVFPLSLPYRFGTTIRSIPASVPYLKADPARRAHWRARLAPYAGRRRIGLVWGGNPRQGDDYRRSISLEALAPLAAQRDCVFISVQKGPPAAQAARPPAGMELVVVEDQLADFSDTAALLCELDLLITVCTSTAHLGGALGIPVWTLLCSVPDWRWFAARRDSPWYPTMQLFRQPGAGRWAPVIEEVALRLRDSGKPRAR